MPANELLAVEALNAWYGESHVLHGVNMTVGEGEVVSLLGRNGAGRTTTMRAIVGLTGRRTGSIRIRGQEAVGMPTHRVARLGVGYTPRHDAEPDRSRRLPRAHQVRGTGRAQPRHAA